MRGAEPMRKFEKVKGYFKIDASARVAVDTETNEGAPAYAQVTLEIEVPEVLAANEAEKIIERMKDNLIAGTSIHADQIQTISKDQYNQEAGEPEQ